MLVLEGNNDLFLAGNCITRFSSFSVLINLAMILSLNSYVQLLSLLRYMYLGSDVSGGASQSIGEINSKNCCFELSGFNIPPIAPNSESFLGGVVEDGFDIFVLLEISILLSEII